MVLSDRNSDNIRNGRRSCGPSPNGHASESSSEDEGKIGFNIFYEKLKIYPHLTIFYMYKQLIN